MLIEKEMRMVDVVMHDYSLIPIISRFGIRMGYGDKTIEELCTDHPINIDFFLTILNTFHDPDYFPKNRLKPFPVSLLVSYLQKAHQDYLQKELPEIEQLFKSMRHACELDEATHRLFMDFFHEYKTELILHMEKEEKKVYPYTLALEKALEGALPNQKLLEQMKNYPIAKYEKEHENVEEKLFDLKNLIIKYLPTIENDRMCFKILRALFSLEKELNEHARIEDTILIPQVQAMEDILTAKRE